MVTVRVLRGQINPNTAARKLVIDDGNFNHGFRITRFVVAGDPSGASQEIGVRLATGIVPSEWDWGDQREIAWAAVRQTAEATWGGWEGAIDHSAIVLRDLYVDAKSSGITSDRVNYLIELEPIMLSDNEAVLALIKERNQSD